MAVHIRMTRMGSHKKPYYRIVVLDSRTKRDGAYIEQVGTYDPLKSQSKIDKEIALKWLNVGAQPSDTVRRIFSKEGVMKSFAEAKDKANKAKPKKVKKATKPKPKTKVKKTSQKKPSKKVVVKK